MNIDNADLRKRAHQQISEVRAGILVTVSFFPGLVSLEKIDNHSMYISIGYANRKVVDTLLISHFEDLTVKVEHYYDTDDLEGEGGPLMIRYTLDRDVAPVLGTLRIALLNTLAEKPFPDVEEVTECMAIFLTFLRNQLI